MCAADFMLWKQIEIHNYTLKYTTYGVIESCNHHYKLENKAQQE